MGSLKSEERTGCFTEQRTHSAVFVFLMVCSVVIGPARCHAADPGTEQRDPALALINEAPIYTGPVQEGDLEALTLDDFEAFGVPSFLPEEQYRKYQEVLIAPPSGIQIPYRMKVVDRELTLDDFFGFNVPEELSSARYESYLSMNPETVDGRTIHYAYVYHAPLPRTETEPYMPDGNRPTIDLKKEA